MKIVATIEARMTSTRLPGKVLALAEGRPMLELMIERLRYVRKLDQIVIATTVKPTDDPVAELAQKLGVGFWRGSEEDVLSRVLEAAQHHKADIIVELTGDCPLIDPKIVETVLENYLSGGADYVSNVLQRSWPIGMDTQVFSTKVLANAFACTSDPQEREHVSLFIYRHSELHRLRNVYAPETEVRPKQRLTLDTPEDLEVIRAVFAALRGHNPAFSMAEMLKFLDDNPDIAAINSGVVHRHVKV